MRALLILSVYLSFSLYGFGGFAAVQDSLPASEKEIRYDKSEVQPLDLSSETIEEFKNDEAFDYSEISRQNWWANFKSWLWNLWLKFWDWLVGDYQSNGFIVFLVHALPYLIIAGIVIFIGWLFYKLNPGATLFGSREKPELFFSEEEEIIRTKNIPELIEEALSNKDYRLAVRYSYLLILQKLTEAEIISYEADKTNSEYIREINSEAIKLGFQRATNLYDHVWYGNFEVTETDFTKSRSIFTSLNNQIPKPIA